MKYPAIAAALLAVATQYPEHTDDKPVQVYRDGAFKIRCKPSSTAIEKVAARYAKGGTFTTKQAPRTGCDSARSTNAAIKQWVKEGDLQLAWDLAHAAGTRLYFASMALNRPGVILDAAPTPVEGFIVGRPLLKGGSLADWSVTHLDSGLSAGGGHKSKAAALAKFDSLADQLAAKVAELPPGDFQGAAVLTLELMS